MKILHISDLHFGAHDPNLKTSLVDRATQIRPDLIVCTGDLADTPDPDLLKNAFEYLKHLQSACGREIDGADNTIPTLIVVPGNHDYRVKGWLWRPSGNAYAQVLDGVDTDRYLERENVWIFGFDSAQKGKLLGCGSITDEDVQRFHTRYEVLTKQHPDKFPGAIKIVAVHHHPFPVNWDFSERQRWLTMENAGRFLSAVLFRRIDVVLHGHEHLLAQARVASSLGANDHEVSIVSLGATLRKVSAPERNWFGVVNITSSGVYADFYPSVGDAFAETPDQKQFCVSSRAESAQRNFERWSAACGYSYRAHASIAVIDKDGDARRTVECEDLTVTSGNCERAGGHKLVLPWTSGYLDCLHAEGAGVDVTISPPIPAGSRENDFPTALEFGRQLTASDSIGYSYHWYAVNAFAMNNRQFDYMYPSGAKSRDLEFTHYVVSDPIELLTVIVKFPDGFRPRTAPRLRVATYEPGKPARGWNRQSDVENHLNREHALRYYESLNIAALRVTNPRQGLSYGIEWSVPPAPSKKEDQYAIDIAAIRQIWLSCKLTAEASAKLSKLIAHLIIGARTLLMKRPTGKVWNGGIEASFMYFDEKHELHLLWGVVETGGVIQTVGYESTLGFGDGIAGRAFKSNQIRIYAPWEGDDSGEPKYYKPLAVGPAHRVLVSIPVRGPSQADEPVREPYGVFSLGSTRDDCPLRLAGPDPQRAELLRGFHSELNTKLYDAFVNIFLDQESVDAESQTM